MRFATWYEAQEYAQRRAVEEKRPFGIEKLVSPLEPGLDWLVRSIPDRSWWGIKQDDRSPADVKRTIGFWVATDSFMSGWGEAPGRSIVAVPFVNADDATTVERQLRLRHEMKRLRMVGPDYQPKLRDGDHYHVYGLNSFR